MITPTPKDYQRARLWAGVTSIGIQLAVIWGLTLFSTMIAPEWQSGRSATLLLLAVAVILPMSQLPFDVLVGHALETMGGRSTIRFSVWLRDWFLGTIPAFAGLGLALALFYGNHLTNGQFAGFVFALSAGGTALELLRIPSGASAPTGTPLAAYEADVARELAELGESLRSIRWYASHESFAVNGYLAGWDRRIAVLSSSVAEHLVPRETALLLAREGWFRRSGVLATGAAIASVWILVGLAAALFFPAENPLQAAVGGCAVITTWCFLSLFIWPSLNRHWMIQADRALCEKATPEEVMGLLNKVQRLNATDTELGSVKTTVFHPIPPLSDRIRSLSK